jgi:LacI family transcriptional regulator
MWLNVQPDEVSVRATILDIARLAGVSRTTVSNVMNGSSKCLPETVEKVRRIADELGYQPNQAARSLVNQRSNMIGLILPSYIDKRILTKSPFFNLIIDAVNAALREVSSFDLLINCVNRNNDPHKVVEWALQRNLAGLIFVGDFNDSSLDRLGTAQIPMVFIDNYDFQPRLGIFINNDDVRGGYLATRHLIERGYRRIACCSSNTVESPVNQRRHAGYRQALQEAGLPEMLVETQNIFFEDGVEQAGRLREQKADGAFAVSDTLALGIIKGLVGLGMAVPGDIGVVGFDNIESSAQFIPALSTIDQNIYQKGHLAVDLLLEAIAKGIEPRHVSLPVNLVIRQST